MVDISLEAYETRENVSIGFSQHKDWDAADEIYRDRRGENDELILWDDQVEGKHPIFG